MKVALRSYYNRFIVILNQILDLKTTMNTFYQNFMRRKIKENTVAYFSLKTYTYTLILLCLINFIFFIVKFQNIADKATNHFFRRQIKRII